MASLRCGQMAELPIIHGLLHGVRDIIWQGHCFINIFSAPSHRTEHTIWMRSFQSSVVSFQMLQYKTLVLRQIQELVKKRRRRKKKKKSPAFQNIGFCSQRHSRFLMCCGQILCWIQIFTRKKTLPPKELTFKKYCYIMEANSKNT